jgi:hypothetical protein
MPLGVAVGKEVKLPSKIDRGSVWDEVVTMVSSVPKGENVMNAHRFLTAAWPIRWLAALLALVLLGGTAWADQRLVIPDQLGIPYWARIVGVSVGDPWWAVVFYHPPGDVPANFDFRTQFFDPSAAGAPTLVQGFAIVADGSLPPIQQNLQEADGGTVPIWFVRPADLFAAGAQGPVTVSVLEGIALKGSADFYHEVLHPTGGAQSPSNRIVASGVLDDGRSFTLQFVFSAGTAHISVTME